MLTVMNASQRVSTDPALEPNRALLEVSEAIAALRELPALFHELAQRLPRVLSFDFLALVLHEPGRNVMRLHLLESRAPSLAPGSELPGELPVEQSPGGLVWETQQPLVIPDVEEETRFPAVMQFVRRHHVRSLCLLPLTTALRRLGAMGVGSVHPRAYEAPHVDFLMQVARQVAVAVDNALNYQDARCFQQQLGRERDRLRLLLEINNALVASLDLRELFRAISAGLRRVMHHEYTSLALIDAETKQLRLHALDFPQGKGFVQEEMATPLEGSLASKAINSRQPVVLKSADC
jgi:formate hydrogenlyase transcriptional activator